MKKLYCLLGGLLIMTSCASDKEVPDMSATDLYNQAFDDLEATKYKAAAEKFEKVETEHPYSQWAVKSKLMGAYAYYKDEKYDDAIMALDRFIKYHPGNKDVAYAYYMKGICYYDQISAADKDQGNTEKAEETFSRLIMLFPNSKYAEDARNKIKLTQDYRAGQEMVIGRYYLHEGNYLSALNRFNVVLENYQTTYQIEEALYREVEIYAIFGMNKYADGYYKILKSNYPDGKWTKKAAAVMEKVSGASSKIKVTTKEGTSEDDKGWFDWLKFGSDEEEKKEADEVEKETVETKTEDDKGWFDWLKFGSDEEEKKEANEVEKETVETKTEENKGWFDWLKFGSDEEEKKEADIETEDKTLLGWWSNKHKTEVSEAENVKAEDALVNDKTDNLNASNKQQIGDIVSENKKEAK